MIAVFGTVHGYTVHELLHHVADILADLTATTANEGHEAAAAETIKTLFAACLKESFDYEARRKAAETAGPKAPTVSGVGHA